MIDIKTLVANLTPNEEDHLRDILSRPGTLVLTDGTVIKHVDYTKEHEDEYFYLQAVLDINGALYALDGTYNSYEGSEWEPFFMLYPVKPEEIVSTIYTRIS